MSKDGTTADWCTAGYWIRLREWQFVALTYDADSGALSLHCEPVVPLSAAQAMRDPSAAQASYAKPSPAGPAHGSRAPLLLGASSRLDRPGHWAHFNGKLARPVLLGRALARDEAAVLARGADPAGHGDLLGSWDLSAEVSGSRVVDRSAHGNHGRAVNAPARAVTGPFWTGTEATLYSDVPHLYDAIHLHEDDMADAEWSAVVELQVPATAPSGLYAFRLRRPADELFVPFVVRPAAPRASLCMLVPTLTWQAYGSNRGPYSYTHDGLVDRGLCIYDGHADGSMVYYATRRRPTRSHHPSAGFENWGSHNSTANLYLVDWLEHEAHEYDLQTDEDVHREGAELLCAYRCVIVGSHPEYWTERVLDALATYLRAGGRVLYLAGNGLFWVTSLDAERPFLMEARKSGDGDYEAYFARPQPGQMQHSTTLEPGGLWSRRGRPARRLIGVEHSANVFTPAAGRWGYRRLPASYDSRFAFVFDGVEDELIGDFGLNLGAAAGYEMDSTLEWRWSPAWRPTVLARAAHESFIAPMRMPVPAVSDLALTASPSGAAVFSAGSVTWTGSLSHAGYDNNVARITGNVLRHFLSVPRHQPVLK